MDHVYTMKTTVEDYEQLLIGLVGYFSRQPTPVSLFETKTYFFSATRYFGFERCINLLVKLGAIRVATIILENEDSVIVAIPTTMEQFEKDHL